MKQLKMNWKTTMMNFSQTKMLLTAGGFFFLLATELLAQMPANDRIQANKVAFITNKLNLTPKQAEQFWPIFNEFETKRKDLKGTFKESTEMAQGEMSDNQAKDEVKKMLQGRQQEVDLEKEYADKFMKVITPKQLLTLFHSEKEFTRMLVKRLREKRGGRREF